MAHFFRSILSVFSSRHNTGDNIPEAYAKIILEQSKYIPASYFEKFIISNRLPENFTAHFETVELNAPVIFQSVKSCVCAMILPFPQQPAWDIYFTASKFSARNKEKILFTLLKHPGFSNTEALHIAGGFVFDYEVYQHFLFNPAGLFLHALENYGIPLQLNGKTELFIREAEFSPETNLADFLNQLLSDGNSRASVFYCPEHTSARVRKTANLFAFDLSKAFDALNAVVAE